MSARERIAEIIGKVLIGDVLKVKLSAHPHSCVSQQVDSTRQVEYLTGPDSAALEIDEVGARSRCQIG